MKGKRVIAAFREIGAAFAECFLPQCCILCQERIPSSQRLCPRCSASVKPKVDVFCPVCRFGEEKDAEGTRFCTHGFVKARTAVRAERPVLALIHRLKYSRERELAPLLAELIVRAGIVDRDFESHDVMCSVPLFGTRERERGFNQSTEIAKRLEAISGVPLVTDILVRTQSTKEQAKLPADLRRRNLLGSFAVRKPRLVALKNVVLVDDVVTTGSTVTACVEALRESQVERVLVVAVVG